MNQTLFSSEASIVGIGFVCSLLVFSVTRFMIGKKANYLLATPFAVALYFSPWWAAAGGGILGHLIGILIVSYLRKEQSNGDNKRTITIAAILIAGALFLQIGGMQWKNEQDAQQASLGQLQALNETCVKTGQISFTQEQLFSMRKFEVRDYLLKCGKKYEQIEREKTIAQMTAAKSTTQ